MPCPARIDNGFGAVLIAGEHSEIWWALVAVSCVFGLACVTPARATGPGATESGAAGSCEIRLTVETDVAGNQALDFRCLCGCGAEGGTGVATLRAVLNAAFGGDGPPPAITQLFVGRIEVQLPEAATALSLAASRAPDWDARRAWSDSGYANRYVRDLLNDRDSGVLADLRAVFAPWRIGLTVRSVEKVLMAVPADLPNGEALLAAGADPTRRLPFDAVVWLGLTRGAE